MNGVWDHRDNPLNWSLPLGRISGIRIRLHLLFILWIIFELFRSTEGWLVETAVMLGMFFLMVLLHEFGHCFGARSVGGDAEDILMWPLGGLASVHAPMTPAAQFTTTAAGPAVNAVFCVLSGATLCLWTGALAALPLNPFQPFGALGGSVASWGAAEWLSLLWGVNYILLLFNLLPTFPMDGGRILQTVLWRYQGYRRATLTATFVGMLGAVAFGLVGLINEIMILVCIAVFGYITCMHHRQMLKAGMLQEEHELGHDFSRGYGAFEDGAEQRPPSWLQRRRAARHARSVDRERHKQQALRARIDDVLEKVHRHGLQSLTRKEKQILKTETERKNRL